MTPRVSSDTRTGLSLSLRARRSHREGTDRIVLAHSSPRKVIMMQSHLHTVHMTLISVNSP